MKKLGLSRDQYGFLTDHNQIDQFERLFDRVSKLTEDPITAETKAVAAVALTTNVTANILSFTLPAGTWNLSWALSLIFGATAILQTAQVGFTKTSAVLPGINPGELPAPDQYRYFIPESNPSAHADINPRTHSGSIELTVTQATVFYFAVRAAFTISTLSAFGRVTSRRIP